MGVEWIEEAGVFAIKRKMLQAHAVKSQAGLGAWKLAVYFTRSLQTVSCAKTS